MLPHSYRVSLLKEALTFSAAHFITFNGNLCEALHGHNYGVRCDVLGRLDKNGYVIDFIALRDGLNDIVRQLDHHVLLPKNHPAISVALIAGEVVAKFESKRWVFPEEDCVLLPIANTTAELLASYIGQTLLERNPNLFPSSIEQMEIMVDENQGQWGCCRFDTGAPF